MTAGTAPVLRCEGLGRVFGDGETRVDALTDVALTLHAGELVLLRGASGSGKTTLLNLLGGFDRPTAGTVWIDDVEVSSASEARLAELRRSRVGYVFQSFALLPTLSAGENIEVPLRVRRMPSAARDARVAELLDLVGLTQHANQRPAELSGGQQQRVGIARALANDPAVLIADEPTGQLDSGNAEAMLALIARLVHERGVAALVSTHDERLVPFADRLIGLRDGRLVDRLGRGRHAASE